MRNELRTHPVALGLAAALLVIGGAAAIATSHPASTENAGASHASSANALAVCGCGRIFMPDAKTEYLSYGGKQYACCTHECHEMAAKDPAASAAMAEKMTAQTLTELAHMNLAVANVVAVTEQGTRALCGCGHEFTIEPATLYIKYDGKSYACCTPGCHAMAAKDPAAAAKMAETKMASR